MSASAEKEVENVKIGYETRNAFSFSFCRRDRIHREDFEISFEPVKETMQPVSFEIFKKIIE